MTDISGVTPRQAHNDRLDSRSKNEGESKDEVGKGGELCKLVRQDAYIILFEFDSL